MTHLRWPDELDRHIQYIPSKVAEYTILFIACGTSSRKDHTLGQKTSLNKLKKTEIVWSMFSDHMAWHWKSIYKKKTTKHKNGEAKQHATKQPMSH